MRLQRLAVQIARRAAGVVSTAALLALAPHALRAQQRETIIHDFGQTPTDGRHPTGTPVPDAASNMIYVTSENGGQNSKGSVVCLNPNTQAATLIHSFKGSDGFSPTGSLFLAASSTSAQITLYGTTLQGGTSTTGTAGSHGTVFQLSGNGSVFKTLHSFLGGRSDGDSPYAGVILASDGNLYGTTVKGGTFGLGTIFVVNPKTGKTAVVHNFSGQTAGVPVDGAKPYARLFEYQSGFLVGTTTAGGTEGAGTIFVFAPKQNSYTLIHSFGATTSDGANPVADLILVPDSTGLNYLYGTTVAGGDHASGTVFRTDPTGRSYDVIHSFGAAGDGVAPWAPLISDAQTGLLYGTTRGGGAFGNGSVFQLLPAVQSQEAVSYSFNPFGSLDDGATPLGGLILYTDGLLYGVCSDQGANFAGTAYSIAP